MTVFSQSNNLPLFREGINQFLFEQRTNGIVLRIAESNVFISVRLKRLTCDNTDVVVVDTAIGRTETDGGTDAEVGFNPIAFGLTEEF